MQTGASTDQGVAHETGRVLKQVFGFDSFRPNQEEIVQAILDQRDAFVVMPTGGGKSLCYQLPAHAMPGTCMVISPLISLMKDQVDAAAATGLRAAYLNSALKAKERVAVQRDLMAGELDLIYVSPERFAMEEFIDVLGHVDLAFTAIDEAHCISEWGHDFRPDYLNLSTLTKRFPDVPVAAFTATATHRVQEDIVTRLGLRRPHVVRASFNRPNLFYKVVPKQKAMQQILRFVKDHAGESGIIYRTTRNSVEETAAMLAEAGIKALPYHAGLDPETRAANQDAFNRDEVDVVVATIAFGMGIDKSNVRYVLHGDLPKNIESYYQETGRAGRDGDPAQCLLLFGYADIPKIRYFLDQILDADEQQHALRCLNEMVNFATVHVCRRTALLKYFGETYPESNCGGCDVCAGEVERVDATRDAQMILSAIARTGERFGMMHVVDVVAGADTERIRQLGHDQIKTYGVGKDREKRYWRFLLDNLLAQGVVEQTEGKYPVLQLCPPSREVLFGERQVHVLRTRKSAPKRKAGAATAVEAYDEALFDELRGLRRRLAAARRIPPYVIFSDRTLHEMARKFPVTGAQMLRISGVGEAKLEKYGKPFMEAIAEFREGRGAGA
ncbi:MAG: DNA helicase RecQ [Kiritimatiellae bacterium]|nr:DNA helicase RecQ [Kiritimatiellia bacterium]